MHMGRMLTKRVQHQHQLRQSQTGAAASQMLMPHPCASSGGLRPRAGAVDAVAASAHGVVPRRRACSSIGCLQQHRVLAHGVRTGVRAAACSVCSTSSSSTGRSISSSACVARATRATHDHDWGMGTSDLDDRDDWGSGVGSGSGEGVSNDWGRTVRGGGGDGSLADASRPGAIAATSDRSGRSSGTYSSSSSSSGGSRSGSSSNGSVSFNRPVSRRSNGTGASTSDGETSVRLSGAGDDNGPRPLTLSWPGSGLYFFWQLGAMQYLSEHFDLTKVPMVGASGGALLSVLAACGVPANAILARARELSLQHGIWERPMALVGIWGVILETWLDDLLPADAAEMCSGRVTVVVTQLPSMRQVGITDFVDRADLINACLASSHVPLVLDYRVSRTCRGVQCVDGQLPDFVSGVNSPILTAGGAAVVLDYFDDAALMRSGRFDMLQLKSYDEIVARVGVGYSYARGLHEGGRFEGFRLDGLALVGGGVVEEVLVPDA